MKLKWPINCMNRLYNQSEEIFFCRANQSLELIFLRKPVSAKFYITFTNSFLWYMRKYRRIFMWWLYHSGRRKLCISLIEFNVSLMYKVKDFRLLGKRVCYVFVCVWVCNLDRNKSSAMIIIDQFKMFKLIFKYKN